ncbi:uncharacterized mitochondrial protein AtMg00810-like [Nymphaea colorata]|uniref:uncharacterized mitochondrial protein AtMg00810-like n=1 Tax=Nymphaea colorata TaxID=210225 RepID=UPI00129D3A1F|nr:uncharacterized mitochondrial protein AtMg00810-like [Nymphaea colorata]
MTDLGNLKYFLGVQVDGTSSGLFMYQSKYAQDILYRAQMQTCNTMSTPMSANLKSSDGQDQLYSNPRECRSLAGALQYLTLTRPDLSYAVNFACQFMHALVVKHFQLLKRILRYVRGTSQYGIQFCKSKDLTLRAFSDTNWAGCPTTRRSTSRNCTFHSPNCIS